MFNPKLTCYCHTLIGLTIDLISGLSNLFSFYRCDKQALRLYSFLWWAMEETLNGVYTKLLPTFNKNGNIMASTLKQLCISLLQQEEVIIRVAQKLLQEIPSGSDISFHNGDMAYNDRDNKDTSSHAQLSLETKKPTKLCTRCSTVEQLIMEMNVKKLDVATPICAICRSSVESVLDTQIESKSERFTPQITAGTNFETEDNNFSHSTGFGVSVGSDIQVRFTVDMVALQSHPSQLKHALCELVCTIC